MFRSFAGGNHLRGALLAALFISLSQMMTAQTSPALVRADFQSVAPQGFGDRQNGWAWAMEWYKGKLYVGTNRAWKCVEQASLKTAFPWLAYPPPDPDVACAADPNDLPLQAEIWAWTPATRTWARVYQSPKDLPIPGVAGKFAPRDIAFRGMHVFREPDGTEALYISGMSAKVVYPGLPGGRLLRTTDGMNFTAVPQTPGTFFGNLNVAGFRGMTTYKNKLYILATDIRGVGTVLESADPAKGDNSFRQISPAGAKLFEVAAFKDFLYLAVSADDGFRVLKTTAEGNPPYQFTTIIDKGGNRPFLPNRDVLSMREFKDRLYIGGNGMRSFFGAELFRINPDDTWDLIAGTPRDTPSGRKEPLSGLAPGLGWVLNAHMWRMEVFDERLYVGTFDLSTTWKDLGGLYNLVSSQAGFDFRQTDDGINYYEIDHNGFGDRFNFGVRSLKTTPYGLFLGTANYYYGLQIFLGTPANTARVATAAAGTLEPPRRLLIEQSNGRTLLSWEAPRTTATRYRIFRWLTSTTAAMGSQGVQEEVAIPTTLEQIGNTDKLVFEDRTAKTGEEYAYFVKAESGTRQSGASNLVQAPRLSTAMTFTKLFNAMRLMVLRGKLPDKGLQFWLFANTEIARLNAIRGNLSGLETLHDKVAQLQLTGAGIDKLAAEDLERYVSELMKRCRLVQAGMLPASAL